MKKLPHRFDKHIYERSRNVIAQGALTNSRRPECFVWGSYPTHLVSSQGCRTIDTSGHSYIDFIMGLGSSILGHAHPEVVEAVRAQAYRGFNHSLGSELEVKMGEKLSELFPFIKRVKLLKTGTEACLASIRIARGYTKRWKVLSAGYHGWGDEFISLTPPATGIGPHSQMSTFQHLDQITEDVAAVIIEPVQTDFSESRIEYLRQLRDVCSERGVMLIFDEIITGFRVPKYSVASMIGVQPDLILFGKAIGGGLPLSVVGGSAEIMEGSDYFVSSTFAGEQLSIAAGLKTIELLQTKYDIGRLWKRSAAFINYFNAICPEKIGIQGYPTRGVFVSHNPLDKALLFEAGIESGLLFGSSFFTSFAHLDTFDLVESICFDILNRLKRGELNLIGQPPVSPFAERIRNN